MDLAKAFESIPLEVVWRRGLTLGWHPGILRLSLQMCSFVRHLTLDGVIGEGVQTLSAILAGTSFATDLLISVLVEPCDELLSSWGGLNLSLVVDDLAIQAVGEPEEVGTTLHGALDQAIRELTQLGGWSPQETHGNRGVRPLSLAPPRDP